MAVRARGGEGEGAARPRKGEGGEREREEQGEESIGDGEKAEVDEGSEEEEEEEEDEQARAGSAGGKWRRAQRAGRPAWPYQLAQNFMVAGPFDQVKSGRTPRTPTDAARRRGTLQEAVDAKGVGVSA